MPDRSRYDVIDCLVVAHASYGLIVECEPGERGFVDSEYISDIPVRSHSWPLVGDTVSAVVLGYAKDGRIRLCAQPGYVAYVKSATDINAIQEVWSQIRSADRKYLELTESLQNSDDMYRLLHWALRRPPQLSEPSVALRALARLPSGVMLELMSDLLNLIIEGNYEREVRALISSIGLSGSGPVLRRSMEEILTREPISVDRHIQLADFLIDLGAMDALNILIEKMLSSGNPEIQAAGMRIRHSELA